ncbi:hypothetical protein [Nocardia sp. NPDC004722]
MLIAYLAPAICAGAGGIATGRADLLIAALTSIAGTSAVVAWTIGMWLRHSGIRYVGLRHAPVVPVAVTFGLGAAAIATAITQLLALVPAFPGRIRIDVPVAASIAAVIITARWCSIQRKEDR